ncbi:translation elongation factor 4 [bacterium]|nr:translation elongation factor 4 [bacterium]
MKETIRNFAIIAHIDHGKSTLADRFLELTATIEKEKMQPQFLDRMDLERERGITIKMQPVRMIWEIPQSLRKELSLDLCILNLIDTPGHVDFNYEVSRSLAAIEGVILLVDATKGIQAQTIANLELAKEQNLVIVPAINKIDLPQARTEEVALEVSELLEVPLKEIIPVSAKTGENVEKLLTEVVRKVPPPQGEETNKLKCLIFDSKYNSYLGAVAFVRVFDGKITSGQEVYLYQAKQLTKVKEVGYFSPDFVSTKELKTGEIGYIALGIKDPTLVKIGDTVTILEKEKISIKPFEGYREPKPVVFTSIYPENPNDWNLLREALLKLKLSDSSLYFEPETKSFLGKGFKCGFLGLLHAEIVTERLKREYGINLLVSSPSVSYKIITTDGKEIVVFSPRDWPDPARIKETKEQYVELKIITPTKYLNAVLKVLPAKDYKLENLGAEKLLISLNLPLRIIIEGFYDKLKSITQGFASMDYKIIGWQKADLVKLEILIAKKNQEALSKIVPRNEAQKEGKKVLEKLYKVLPPQMFDLALQAKVGGRIIARKTIRAKRKDVIAPLYGGDVTRKMKLLKKQKKGKKKLQERGQFSVPPEVLWKVFRQD